MESSKSTFPVLSHPLTDIVERKTDEYFLTRSPFINAKSRDEFLAARFSQCICMYFPNARDDRIHLACRLFGILFLVDDLLEYMTFDEGAAYNNRIMSIIRGDEAPDSSVLVEAIFHDIWSDMRACDQELTDAINEPLFIFMRSQTDKRRAESMSLMQYLEYRDADVGRELTGALLRFCHGFKLTQHQLELVKPAEVNAGRHITVINDIWSFDKEVLTAKNANKEGGSLCNCVAILSNQVYLSTAASKRVLQTVGREFERKHQEIYEGLLQGGHGSAGLTEYFEALRYTMSGNEAYRVADEGDR